jgi:hypothetical protein
VRLASLPSLFPVTELVERLESLERKLGGADAPSRPAPETLKTTQAISPLPEIPASSSPAPAENKSEKWKNFVAFVMKEKKFLGSFLEKVQPVELSPDQLRIAVEDRRYLNYLEDAENLNALKDLARRFFASNIAVTIAPEIAAPVEPEGGLMTTKRADPLTDMTEEVMRVLGGSIKEIKRNT